MRPRRESWPDIPIRVNGRYAHSATGPRQALLRTANSGRPYGYCSAVSS
ncbi:hypothetical protein BJ996_000477 [Streptomyces phaeogriseichromatogenes]|nr:hypothetical protein [Streptomyces murinus]